MSKRASGEVVRLEVAHLWWHDAIRQLLKLHGEVRCPRTQCRPKTFDALKGLTQESSVIVEGKVRADKRAPGGFELDVSNVQCCRKFLQPIPTQSRPKNTALIS